MELEKAKEIVKGRLQFGNPEHLEVIRTIERDRVESASACDGGFDITVEVYRDAKTGLRRTRMTLPESSNEL